MRLNLDWLARVSTTTMIDLEWWTRVSATTMVYTPQDVECWRDVEEVQKSERSNLKAGSNRCTPHPD